MVLLPQKARQYQTNCNAERIHQNKEVGIDYSIISVAVTEFILETSLHDQISVTKQCVFLLALKMNLRIIVDTKEMSSSFLHRLFYLTIG